MSAGPFVISRYFSSELNEVMPIRLQPETLIFAGGVANEPPAQGVSLALYANSGGSKRSYGVHARSVSLEWIGTPPAGYAPGRRVRVPVMTQGAYSAYIPGTEGQYLGSPVRVVSRSPEAVR